MKHYTRLVVSLLWIVRDKIRIGLGRQKEELILLSCATVMEVNPSLMQERDAQQTIAIGCSLIRSAFGKLSG